MKIRAWQILVSVAVGVPLGLVLAPAIAATRPLPPPIVQRVPIHTADVLDTGTACVYTWGEAVFVWQREHIGIQLAKPCPPVKDAQRRWHEAQRAPVAVSTQHVSGT